MEEGTDGGRKTSPKINLTTSSCIPGDMSPGNTFHPLAFESESSGGVDNNIDLKNHDEEVIENKEVMDLVDFGCGKSVYLGTRTVENEFITPKSCRSVGCIKNGGIREWPKMEKASHVNFTFNSRLWKFDMWEWLKRKRETHIKFRFCKFNMWEWRKRKKI
ncbi:hypothetical protein Tco_1333225, partial [Tanacetum coccineum]